MPSLTSFKSSGLFFSFKRFLHTTVKSQSLEHVVMLDFETTGFSPTAPIPARVIEVGARRLYHHKAEETFSSLCNPGITIPKQITEITGITNKEVAEQPPTTEVMLALKKFIGDATVVAHNKAFEERFLRSEWQRFKADWQNPSLCTLLLARRLIDAPNYKLNTLFNHINPDKPSYQQKHRALDDVNLTIDLWLHLLQEIEVQHGRKNAKDIDFLMALMKQPTLKSQLKQPRSANEPEKIKIPKWRI